MSHQGRRALVTGATGFVGSHLVRALVADGWCVHIVVRPESQRNRLVDSAQSITIHEHHGTTENLVRIVESAQPHIVFHLAALSIADHESKDLDSLIASNVLFAAQLVEAMAVNGVRRLITTGTSWQHYHSSEYCPVNLYAATKQAFDSILVYYANARAMSVITLKLYDTYGPADFRAKLFSYLAKAANNATAVDFSPGEQLIDLVHVDDVVGAYLLAAKKLFSDALDSTSPGRMEEFTVSSGSPLTLRELANTYARVVDKDLNIHWGARSYRQREVMTPWKDGKPVPGWAPKVTLEQGIRRLQAGLEDQPSDGREKEVSNEQYSTL